jgi:hypothetical protein
MLEKDPNKRITIEELIKDEWINKERSDLSIEKYLLIIK